MKILTQKITLLLALTILLSFGVNAFAVTMPYMKDKTLGLYPGESTEFTIGLQNMIGDADQTVMVTLEEGNEIARIIDKENVYKVPKGTNDRVARLRISIPSNTPLGTEYRVRFKASDVVEVSGDMAQVASGLSDYFIVRVGPLPVEKTVTKEKSVTGVWWIIGAAVLVVVIVCLIFYGRLRKRK